MNDRRFIPIGYMLKSVVSPAPDWIGQPAVRAVHSVSGCVSTNFADYIPLWRHNGWWLFDTPDAVKDAAAKLGVVADGFNLFYYEVFDQQYDDDTKSWQSFEPESGGSFTAGVKPPNLPVLSGYDVVTFFVRTSPECSPLSCNGLAANLPVNERCLFDRFEDACSAIERGEFKDSEPGPYRIVAVYQVDADDG